jgi:uncharacterized protein YndB with AHSA1/START domain
VTDEPNRTLRIERAFQAPIERVFDAWTSPEVMRRWFHCEPDWSTPVAEVDLRVGGKVRIVMHRSGDTDIEAGGEYLAIERPHRLVMTWAFSDDRDNQQLIELSFSESGGSTTVVMVNSQISTEERREAQQQGWHGCLDELARMLAD